MALLKNELSKEMKRVPGIEFNYIDELTVDKFTPNIGMETKEYISKLDRYYTELSTNASTRKEAIINYWDSKSEGSYQRFRQEYHNEATTDIVRNIYEKNKIKSYKDHLIQQVDPIFEKPWVRNIFDYRAQFFAPSKHFLGHTFDTFWFNMWVVWLMTAFFYVALYYDWLKRFMDLFQK